MTKLAFQNLWAHKRRLLGTFLAVLLGVSFLSGTLVLGDTLRSNFTTLFDDALAGTDVVVRPAPLEGSSGDDNEDGFGQTLDASVIDEVAAVDGVRVAHGQIGGIAQILDADGERLGGEGPPTLGGNWIDDEDLNPYTLAEGRAPGSTEEVVIDQRSATDGDLSVGDTTTVLVPDPITVTITGIATFGSEDSFGSVTYVGFTDEGAAKHLAGGDGSVSEVLVAADEGVSQADLAERITAAVGDGTTGSETEVITGEALAAENLDSLNADFLGFLTNFLVVFAAIALLVGTFSIYNTFSIVVAQRSREAALLRAIGATRRQVLTATLAEAFAIGLTASVLGLFVGLGFATALKAMFDAFGFGLPTGGLSFEMSTVVIGLIVGVVVTMLAAVVPARRASRIAPVEALRSSEVEPTTVPRRRTISGVVLTLLGLTAIVVAALARPDNQLWYAGIGALVTLIGMVVLGPAVAKPISKVLGSPFSRLGGVTGELATGNALRNPRRTASTAAALMVGVSVVVLFSTVIASAAASVETMVERSFGGDLVVSTGGFGTAVMPPSIVDQAENLDSVDAAVGLGFGTLVLDDPTDNSLDVSVTDPAAIADMFDLGDIEGSMADVTGDHIAISQEESEDHGWVIGDTVTATYPDGAAAELEVVAIYEHEDIAGSSATARDTWQPHDPQSGDSLLFVTASGSVDAARHDVETLTAPLGNPEVQDEQEYSDSVAAQLNQLLGLITVMLALAIIIAVMGIANTLALSVHERTRELGLLRSVGSTRRQVKRMVRWEAMIISTFGTAGGIGLGIVLGWGLVQAAFGDSENSAFALPVPQLVTIVVVGIAVGVIAALRPARRAAKMAILDAIAA
ncbi:MAG TPA: FtsX-like permease family protein [Microthrixaceae bacterium]|nr:FtsX-like permease family protein [Microthrixaceae bacterium]